MEILRRAGKKAEDKGLKQVTIEEIKQAIAEAEKTKTSFVLSELNEHQRVIYEILEKKKKMPSAGYTKNIVNLCLNRLLRELTEIT